ncbi:MAG: baseplate J/gp47 family protein [Planctomycetota bacterium]
MTLTRPTRTSIINGIKGDIEALVPGTDLSYPNSLLGILAAALGGAVHELFGRITWLAIQLFPDTCEGEYLERWSTVWDIFRTPPVAATGTVACTGTDGTDIPAGTIIIRADGTEYETDELATIAGGTANVAITAVVAGDDGNTDPSAEFSFQSPIPDINTLATVDAEGITGGVDIEDDVSLRANLLNRIKEPPHGGASFDYPKWGKGVSGVTRAWCHPLYDEDGGAGLGHVGLSFVMDGKTTYPNIVFNGDFADDTADWEFGQDATGGWSYDATNKEADCDGSQTTDVWIKQFIDLVPGRTYKLSYQVKNYTGSGTVRPYINTQGGASQSSNITVTDESIVAPATATYLAFLATGATPFQGSIDNVVLIDETSEIIPASSDIETVEAYLEDLRPVCAHLHVLRLNADEIDFTIALNEYTGALSDVKAAIEAELEDLIYREGEPGSSIYLSHIREAISLATGEVDHTLVSPTSDVTIGATEIAVLGTITWS